uniref:protein-serine/threonine phosphatase n=1 Tax=Coptotermes formosanus TaxID=36987 RepID=R4UP03_COPFO|nr:Ser/thr protein phosphatase [Coptotermes formosanus]
MPLSAKIDSNILCLHGGISPLLASINQLKMLERPCSNFSDKLISDILWSDPRDVDDFERSDRGLGCYFGEAHLKSFLEDNHLNLLVRAHECVYECKYTHDNMCLTVFGASNYCGLSGNKASVLIIHSANEREIGNFDPMRYLTREDVTFKKISYHFRSSSSTAFTKRLVLLPNKRLNKRNTKTILPMLI